MREICSCRGLCRVNNVVRGYRWTCEGLTESQMDAKGSRTFQLTRTESNCTKIQMDEKQPLTPHTPHRLLIDGFKKRDNSIILPQMGKMIVNMRRDPD
jgi:hypothetical protein